MDQQQHRRDLYQGYGNGLARGFEIMATPLLFALIGIGLDKAFGTRPLLLIVFACAGAIGMFLREWYAYAAKMSDHESKSVWGKR